MKKWSIRGVLLLLVFALLTIPALADETEILIPRIRTDEPGFTDIQDIWCEESVRLCWQTGLMAGTSETTFSPEGKLSTTQLFVIAARLQDLLSGGTGIFREPNAGEKWYEPALEHYAKAVETANVTLVPTLSESVAQLAYATDGPAPRRWFVQLLSGALEASGTELPVINEPVKIPDSDEHAVHVFYRAGILNGTDRCGRFRGTSDLTRGQAAAILARIIDPNQRLSFSQKDFEEYDLCRDILQLDPEMVLFTVEGKEYTVLQYAEDILSAAYTANHPMHGEPDPEGTLRDIRTFCYFTIAPVTLAESAGIALTETEEANLLSTAREKDGYRGLSSDYWLWKDRVGLLKNKLEKYYVGQYGSVWNTGEFYLNRFLFDEGDRLLKTAVLSSNMDKVDLNGIAQRIS